MIDTILSSELVHKPWPVVHNRNIYFGEKNSALSECMACQERYCSEANIGFGKCRFGIRFFAIDLEEGKLVFPEYVKKRAKAHKRWFPESTLVKDWTAKVVLFNSQIAEEMVVRESNILHSFHDAFKWASQVNQMAEKLISKEGKGSFRENLDSASNELKSLYKCSGLLLQAANATEVYLNPESAAYGEKRSVKVYQLFDKVQAIIYHGQGKAEGKRFRLQGESFKSIDLYDSFPVIALCLLQNAIKYSMSEEIEVIIEDVVQGVEVRVVSIGPYIDRYERSVIFDKGVRGKYAQDISNDGMGIGLYVAQCVAKMNGFDIGVNSNDLGYEKDSIPVAQNTFYFTVDS